MRGKKKQLRSSKGPSAAVARRRVRVLYSCGREVPAVPCSCGGSSVSSVLSRQMTTRRMRTEPLDSSVTMRILWAAVAQEIEQVIQKIGGSIPSTSSLHAESRCQERGLNLRLEMGAVEIPGSGCLAP
ncbi:unnamed protein product [Pleuronectes platessa]|uniref:Uncharacterized protein n=1 Tax=Pleuronectes platessa TaxID=8262 RepID=A0A9N7VUV8_PLEPL|nr:unnamed protein product [Pleuronectes platessa]